MDLEALQSAWRSEQRQVSSAALMQRDQMEEEAAVWPLFDDLVSSDPHPYPLYYPWVKVSDSPASYLCNKIHNDVVRHSLKWCCQVICIFVSTRGSCPLRFLASMILQSLPPFPLLLMLSLNNLYKIIVSAWGRDFYSIHSVDINLPFPLVYPSTAGNSLLDPPIIKLVCYNISCKALNVPDLQPKVFAPIISNLGRHPPSQNTSGVRWCSQHHEICNRGSYGTLLEPVR